MRGRHTPAPSPSPSPSPARRRRTDPPPLFVPSAQLTVIRLFSLYHNTRYLNPQSLLTSSPVLSSLTPALSDNEGTLVKAILPCTPLAIVKALEHCHIYNVLLPYGSRAYGKTITVVNR